MDGSQWNYTQPDPQQYTDAQNAAPQYTYTDPQYSMPPEYQNPQYEMPQNYGDMQYVNPQYGYPDMQYDYAQPYYDTPVNTGKRTAMEVLGLLFGSVSVIFAMSATITLIASIHRIVEALRTIIGIFFSFGDIVEGIVAVPVLSGFAIAFAVPAFILKGVVKRKAETYTAKINVGFGLGLAGCIIGVIILAIFIVAYIYIRQTFMNFIYSTF